MKAMILGIALLLPVAALAQQPAPMVGDRPLKQIGPRAGKAKAEPAPKAGSMTARMKACLDIEDGSKERLNCYDEIIKPQPKAKAPKAKVAMDCRAIKEEDERLTCFNGFASKLK